MAKQVARKAPKAHYPAPYALVETWRRSGGGTQALLAAERKSVVKLAGTPTARNLTRVFFLQERLKGLGGKDSGIKHVHVERKSTRLNPSPSCASRMPSSA